MENAVNVTRNEFFNDRFLSGLLALVAIYDKHIESPSVNMADNVLMGVCLDALQLGYQGGIFAHGDTKKTWSNEGIEQIYRLRERVNASIAFAREYVKGGVLTGPVGVETEICEMWQYSDLKDQTLYQIFQVSMFCAHMRNNPGGVSLGEFHIQAEILNAIYLIVSSVENTASVRKARRPKVYAALVTKFPGLPEKFGGNYRVSVGVHTADYVIDFDESTPETLAVYGNESDSRILVPVANITGLEYIG